MYMKIYDRENKDYYIKKFFKRIPFVEEEMDYDEPETVEDLGTNLKISSELRSDFSLVMRETSKDAFAMRLLPYRIDYMKTGIAYVKYLVTHDTPAALFKFEIQRAAFEGAEEEVEDEHPVTTRFRAMVKDEAQKIGVDGEYKGFLVIDGVTVVFMEATKVSQEYGVWTIPGNQTFAQDASVLFDTDNISVVTKNGKDQPVPYYGYVMKDDDGLSVVTDKDWLEMPFEMDNEFVYLFAQQTDVNDARRYAVIGKEIEKDGISYYMTRKYDNFQEL